MNEQEKYEAMWARPEYRQSSPGERIAPMFVEWSGVVQDDTVVDFGCGTGRGAKRIHELTGCNVIAVDFAVNCLDQDVRDASWATFLEADLSKGVLLDLKHGFCSDVMEHLPLEEVDAAINNIMAAAGTVFFQISLVHDGFGKLLGPGVHLHLSVFPHEWWVQRFKDLGYTVLRHEDHTSAGVYYVK